MSMSDDEAYKYYSDPVNQRPGRRVTEVLKQMVQGELAWRVTSKAVAGTLSAALTECGKALLVVIEDPAVISIRTHLSTLDLTFEERQGMFSNATTAVANVIDAMDDEA